ncbi:MAG: DNA-processing protein DprA [Candidatus Paceibacterota bacterium]
MDFLIQKISINHDLFPDSLRKIKNPPQELYYYGKINKQENCLAIVGARICSKYGQECCLEIGSQIAEAGLTIVSGLAQGIDSFAHLAALRKNARTIAVLGTAIDNIYPKENLPLAKEILKNNGLIISEYGPGQVTAPYSFAERNRLIAGLGMGTLVIEAKEKSGSLLTAKATKEQGKKIFAIPGNIHSSTSKGCHFLIKNGAKLIENGNDILLELKINNLPLFLKNDKPTTEPLNEEEKIINALIKEPLQIEDLIKITKLSPNKIMGLLSVLEIKNKIIDLGDNTYCLNRN